MDTGISIHSLRVEGDAKRLISSLSANPFQSTPSAWRETTYADCIITLDTISIHSLRVEGDF